MQQKDRKRNALLTSIPFFLMIYGRGVIVIVCWEGWTYVVVFLLSACLRSCDAMRCVALRCVAMRCVGLLRVDGGVDGVNIFHSYHSIPPILFTLSSLSFLFFPHLPSFLLSSYPLHSFNIILNNPHFIK